MFLSLVSHQLLLILKASLLGFTRDWQQWKCDEITAAVLRFKAQDLYRPGTKIKYSEGVNPGHLLLSEQKLVHRRILSITSGRPQAPWALQIPQVKSSWPGSERKQRQPFPLPHSDLWSHERDRGRSARCPSRRAARGVTGADLPNGAAACCLLPGLVRRPQGDLEKQREVQLSRAAPKHRELKKQEARVRSRKDPFLTAALIRAVAKASRSLCTRLCVCRHFPFASP